MGLTEAAVAAAVYAALTHAAGLAACAERPVAQALARIVTLLPAYLHELAHAAVSVACTGSGRIRLHSVRQRGGSRSDGQVTIASADVFYFGPRTNALVSAAPSLLLWPAALWLLWLAWPGGGALPAAGAAALVHAGRLSASDLEQLRAARRHAR